jgi:flagellar motor switch protein FliN/FliY
MATSTTREQALVQAICSQFANAVSTFIGGSPEISSGGAAPADGWQIRLTVKGRGTGQLWIGISADDAAAITKRIVGVEEAQPAEGAIRDTWRELAAQAAGAVALDPAAAGLDIAVNDVEPSFAGVPSKAPSCWSCEFGEELKVVFSGWSSVTIEEAQSAKAVRLPAGAENLDLILNIDLPMAVRFGRTELALSALTRLGPGSIIDLGRAPDEPVEVLVSGRVVAHGDVVVVGGNYGVRITEIVSRPEAFRRH